MTIWSLKKAQLCCHSCRLWNAAWKFYEWKTFEW